jgi:O-antigen ligase
MASFFPPTTFETSLRTPGPSYVALGLSMALQVPALGLLLLGHFNAGGILIYAVVCLALYYGIVKRNYLNSLAIFVNSYGLSLPFRDSMAIGFSTFYYAFILIALFMILGRTSKSLTKFLPIIFCFFLYWFSWSWGIKPIPYGATVRLWGTMAGMVLTYLAVNKVEDLEFLFWALILGSILFIPSVFFFQSPEERFGLLQLADNMEVGNPVSYMGHIAPWMIVGFALVVWEKNLNYRKLMIGGLLILTGLLVYSTSRTNIFLVAIGMTPIIIKALPKRPAFILVFLMVIIATSAMVVVKNPMARQFLIDKLPLPSLQKEQLIQHKGSEKQAFINIDKYSTGRFFLMQAGIEKFLSSPLIGVGLANSNVNLGPEKSNMTIHCFWVKLLAESGLLVTLPLITILFWQFFRYIWRSNGRLPGLSLGLFCGVVAFGLVAHGLDLVMWPMYGLALAIATMKNYKGS